MKGRSTNSSPRSSSVGKQNGDTCSCLAAPSSGPHRLHMWAPWNADDPADPPILELPQSASIFFDDYPFFDGDLGAHAALFEELSFRGRRAAFYAKVWIKNRFNLSRHEAVEYVQSIDAAIDQAHQKANNGQTVPIRVFSLAYVRELLSRDGCGGSILAVSYTHLTLPTIHLV